MNIKILSLTTVIVGAFALTACDQKKSATADLDRILGVASDSMVSFESKNSSNMEALNEGNVMDKFSSSYASDLNASVPPIHSGPIGVKSEKDGSFAGFDDKNNNGVKDADEKDLFKLEVDTANNRLLASNEGEVRESGFSGSGFIMGMLLGNMLSRQRATGARPAMKKATPKRSASKSKSFGSAKSRVGSGSHSSGK
ncbi:MAG: hypothetical protein L3J51_05545 [Cocleimonas sp.]|nr:hypothetical protein [Cocleimonas sp.]